MLSVIFTQPLTSAIWVLCVGLWFYQWNWRVSPASVGLNYTAVCKQGEWWRALTSAFSHVDIMHILFNMYSLTTFGPVEAAYGSWYYFRLTVIFLVSEPCLPLQAHPLRLPLCHRQVATPIITLAFYHVLIHRFGFVQYQQVTGIGYSCVIFGWLTVVALQSPTEYTNLMFGLTVPTPLLPVASLVISSLLIRRSR